jgi:16S rRNA (adenine1518-N6/adenine1519-N6)-dimethyltransferase
MEVRAKKKLGQHFLNDKNIAQKIVKAVLEENPENVLEIGPGTGILSDFLLKEEIKYKAIEIDEESVEYLKLKYPEMEVIEGDFLKIPAQKYFTNRFAIIGNFPYNISSQIFFKLIENRDQVPLLVGMIQKEVAERIQEKEGSKTYGILSVLLQTFFDVKYLFTVNETVFSPPPKVKSAVIKLKRNNRKKLPCDESLYFSIVKESFNQRRKMLRSSLRKYTIGMQNDAFLTKRPEQLSVEDFIKLTQIIEGEMKNK